MLFQPCSCKILKPKKLVHLIKKWRLMSTKGVYAAWQNVSLCQTQRGKFLSTPNLCNKMPLFFVLENAKFN